MRNCQKRQPSCFSVYVSAILYLVFPKIAGPWWLKLSFNFSPSKRDSIEEVTVGKQLNDTTLLLS